MYAAASERDSSDFGFSECDSSLLETAGFTSPISNTAALGSPAFANAVYLTAFGTPFCVTASIERAGFKSCLHEASAAFSRSNFVSESKAIVLYYIL